MMKRIAIAAIAALGLAGTAYCASPGGQPTSLDRTGIKLFPKGAPGALPNMPPEITELRPPNPGPIVRNVSDPSLLVYPADPKIANGTAMIIAPGGGFHLLTIENEGVDVAKWLNSLGITCFVLKYRLIATGDDVQTALLRGLFNWKDLLAAIAPLKPLATADGEAAVRFVRAHAAQYGIGRDRVGMLGFSAGGAVAVWTTLANHPDSRPDYLVTIYPGLTDGALQVPAKAPPLFDLVAQDDPIVRSEAERLQAAWKAAGVDTTFITVATGGHGFGMAKHGTASDGWTEQLKTWLDAKGLLRK